MIIYKKAIENFHIDEKQLFASLVAIWENRRFIDQKDLDNLKFFENKEL